MSQKIRELGPQPCWGGGGGGSSETKKKRERKGARRGELGEGQEVVKNVLEEKGGAGGSYRGGGEGVNAKNTVKRAPFLSQ